MKILLAIDDSTCSDAAINAVLGQFRPDDADVRILHADEWPKGLSTSLAFGEGPGAADDLLAARAEARRRGGEVLAAATRRLKAAHFRVHGEMREGDAPHAILDCASQWHPDLIVIGSHGRKGLDRFVLGSVSERIVRAASCSVQVVRAA